MGVREILEADDDIVMASAREFGLDEDLEQRHTELLETGGLDLDISHVDRVRERRTPPHREASHRELDGFRSSHPG
jgi:hypothetical protein